MAEPTKIKFRIGGVTFTIGLPALIELPPRVFRGRLTGMLFDTDRTFLLPSAMTGIKRVKRFYDEHKGMEVLIVGHADRAGNNDYNLSLSVDRAEAIAAFLQDKVEDWLAWYGKKKPEQKRWGVREDQHMLSALADGAGPFYAGPINGIENAATQAATKRFQEFSNSTRGTALATDGFLGENTRRELVTVYMQQDETTLPEGAKVVTHGCGEFHPEVSTADGVAEEKNRRVEVFLFEGPVTPAPVAPCPGPDGCVEHAEWLGKVVETVDFSEDKGDLAVTVTGDDGKALEDVELEFSDLLETGKTDASGRFDFVGLPPGDSTLTGRKPGFAKGEIPVKVPSGASASAALKLSKITLEALDPAGKALTGARMGLWDHAFDPSVPKGGVPKLMNKPADADNFVGADSRRFVFRIKDAGATGPITLNWKTLDAAKADDDAPATASLTLEETPAGSKTFVSKAVMLVTDEDDAKQGTDSGLTAPATETGVRARGTSNHRLRRGKLDGFLRAEYVGSAGGDPIPLELPIFSRAPDERRSIAVQIFVLRNPATGKGVVDTAAGSRIWTRDLRIFRETYARLGVDVRTATHADGEAGKLNAVKAKDGAFFLYLIDPPAGITANSVTFANELTIAGQFKQTANTLRLFYVFSLASTNRGEAWPDIDFTDDRRGAAYVNASATGTGPYSPIHEIGHILTNKSVTVNGGHYNAPTAPAGNRLMNDQNLMRDATSSAEGFDQSKRLWNDPDKDLLNQFANITGSHYTRPF